MIPELGQLCLCLAFVLAILQGCTPLAQHFCAPHPVRYVCKPLATVSFMLVTAAFATLIHSYAVSDFSVMNVVLNSNRAQPLIYKITGAWGNHEGSMLLWAEVLAVYGFLIAFFRARDAELKAAALAVLGWVNAGFLAFILFTSNPFLRVWPVPQNGEDLNPLLQDIGLSFHPPTLYIGYVGFGVVFAYAVAGILLNRIDSAWAKTVHPWIMLPWSFLTLGIGAGSWWAYRELGWGGWWFWDPVENVSLLPWLAATALLHSNMVLEKRGQLARWVVLLAILTFSLSLIGTFIVRSGLITSVHSFAADPARGIFILSYIVLVSGGALFIYGVKELTPSAPVQLLSRAGFILLNNLLLLTLAATVLLAILYPVFLELAGGDPISVGPHYFNATFIPIAAPLLILAALAPLIAWDRTGQNYLWSQVKSLLPALAVALIICFALARPIQLLALGGIMLSSWLAWGAIRYILRIDRANISFSSSSGLRYLASFTGHLALAVFVLAATASTLFKQTYEAPLTATAPIHMGGFTLKLEKAARLQEQNYITRRATFSIEENGQVIAHLSPELRYYPVRQTQTTEAAIYSSPLRDIYLVLGESAYMDNKKESVLGIRMYVAPAQQWLWIGFLLGGLSGLLALAGSVRRILGEGKGI